MGPSPCTKSIIEGNTAIQYKIIMVLSNLRHEKDYPKADKALSTRSNKTDEAREEEFSRGRPYFS